MADKVKVIQIETDTAQKSVKDLRNELKSLRDTLLNVDESTVEYAQALQRAGNIQNQLREQMNMVNASAMDFGQILGNITGSLAGVMSGLQAGIAVMNLFGIKNKEVIESLQKMQNIMALTQGIAGIEKGIKSLANLTRALRASTTAARLFSAALTPKGLLAIAAAITAITYAVVKLKEKLSSETLKIVVEYDESTFNPDINNPYRKHLSIQQVDDFITAFLANRGVNSFIVPNTTIETHNFNDFIKYYTEYLKKSLKSEQEIQDALNEERQKYLRELRSYLLSNFGTHSANFYGPEDAKLIEALMNKRQNNYALTGDDLKQFVDSVLGQSITFSYILKNIDNLPVEEFSWSNVMSELFGTSKVNTNDFYKEYNKLLPQIEKYLQYKESLDFYISTNNELFKAAEDAEELENQREQKQKSIDEANERAEAADKERKKRLEELKQLYSELIDEIDNYGKSEELIAKRNLEREFKDKEQTLIKQRKLDLGYYVNITGNTVETDDALMEDEIYLNARNKLWEEYDKRLQKLRDDYRQREKEEEQNRLNEEIGKLREQADIQIGIIEKEYSSNLYLNRKSQALILEEVSSGFFQTTNAMEKRLDELAEEDIQRNIEALKKELEIENLGATEKLQLMNELAQEEIRLNDLVDQHHANRVQRELGRYSTLGYSVGEIFTNLGSLMEEGSEEAKALQIMGATINMLAGITAAVSGAFTTHSGPWDIAIAAAQAAAIATSGAITIAQMAKTTKENASSVGMSAASTALTLVAPVQYTQDVQGAELERSIASQKVYVLESDITNSQKKVSVVESEARF